MRIRSGNVYRDRINGGAVMIDEQAIRQRVRVQSIGGILYDVYVDNKMRAHYKTKAVANAIAANEIARLIKFAQHAASDKLSNS